MNRAWLSGHRAAELGVLVVVLAWAANFIVVKVANREIPPIAFAWIRFSFSALLLLVLLRWREGSPSRRARSLARRSGFRPCPAAEGEAVLLRPRGLG